MEEQVAEMILFEEEEAVELEILFNKKGEEWRSVVCHIEKL